MKNIFYELIKIMSFLVVLPQYFFMRFNYLIHYFAYLITRFVITVCVNIKKISNFKKKQIIFVNIHFTGYLKTDP